MNQLKSHLLFLIINFVITLFVNIKRYHFWSFKLLLSIWIVFAIFSLTILSLIIKRSRKYQFNLVTALLTYIITYLALLNMLVLISKKEKSYWQKLLFYITDSDFLIYFSIPYFVSVFFVLLIANKRRWF